MEIKNNLKKTDGIIIKEENYKEFDKLITILTSDFGKIQVYAFGVRKPTSKNIGKTRKFSYSSFELRLEGGKYRLENIVFKKSFDNIINDYMNTCYASYMLELIDYFGFENNDEYSKLSLLYYALKAINDGNVNLKLIKCVFELKLLFYEGIYKDSSMLYDKDDTLKYAWDFILNSKCENLFSFNLSEDILDKLIKELNMEMRDKVNKKFETLDFINS